MKLYSKGNIFISRIILRGSNIFFDIIAQIFNLRFRKKGLGARLTKETKTRKHYAKD